LSTWIAKETAPKSIVASKKCVAATRQHAQSSDASTHGDSVCLITDRRALAEQPRISFDAIPLREAPFSFAVAANAAKIELPQSDLGDIFLAATALVSI
jgi:hypothetical protein